MEESNKLTEKKYWNDDWKNIKLPARFFYDNYSHIIISKLIEKYVSKNYSNFLEIGGCPGRWADYFFTKFNLTCDSMDYTKENTEIIRKNYQALGIKGGVFLGDISDLNIEPKKKYDIVLSDGLVEHFVDSSEVFKNHVKYLNDGGLLIIGVPNIKKSWFYNFFAKYDKKSYIGFRHINKEELGQYAIDNNLEILHCSHIGVFNFGLINAGFFQKIVIVIDIIASFLLRLLKIRKESKAFSPYICLIAKK